MSSTDLRCRTGVSARAGAGPGASARAARPMATMVVTSQCPGTANSAATPVRLNARNWRADSPSARACSVMCATACPRS